MQIDEETTSDGKLDEAHCRALSAVPYGRKLAIETQYTYTAMIYSRHKSKTYFCRMSQYYFIMGIKQVLTQVQIILLQTGWEYLKIKKWPGVLVLPLEGIACLSLSQRTSTVGWPVTRQGTIPSVPSRNSW